MTIQTYLDERTFRRFTMFDILKRKRYWKSPALFASILGACAIISFIMHRVDGAILLGIVLLVVGLGMPLVYFSTFFRSLKKLTKEQNLDPPRLVYTLDFPDGDAFSISNGHEEARYEWKQASIAYRDRQCIYLFITQDKAFLLPAACATEGFDALWDLIVRHMGSDRCRIIAS
ncbi:MAG: YcxB family protein [Sphaerochaetaceae bacterium]